MKVSTIAIFPLKLVLFPESIIPLHIFENRYKTMINDFLDNNLRFGINLTITGKNFETGCEVKKLEIIKKYDDGRMDIIVYGGRRYKIKNLHEGEYGYLIGEADFFDDESAIYDKSTLIDCLKKYNDIVRIIKNENIKEIDYNRLNTLKPSFLLAQKTGLTTLQKQNILELKSENERLMSILVHLEKVIPALKEAELVSSIIKNDGYLMNK